MNYVKATIIVTTGVAVAMRQLADRLDRRELSGLFSIKLSPSGNLPATHIASTGMFPKKFIALMLNPTLMYQTAKKAWERDGDVFPLTQAQVTNRLSNCTVILGQTMTRVVGPGTRERTWEADPETFQETLTRLGLKIIVPDDALLD